MIEKKFLVKGFKQLSLGTVQRALYKRNSKIRDRLQYTITSTRGDKNNYLEDKKEMFITLSYNEPLTTVEKQVVTRLQNKLMDLEILEKIEELQ